MKKLFSWFRSPRKENPSLEGGVSNGEGVVGETKSGRSFNDCIESMEIVSDPMEPIEMLIKLKPDVTHDERAAIIGASAVAGWIVQ